MSKNMIKWTLGLLVVGCMLAMAAPAGAEFVQRDSSAFTWKYEMGVLPDAENLDNNFSDPPANTDPIYDFRLTDGGFVPTTDGDILTVDASHPFQNGSYRNEDNWRSDANISGANGWTFEARARVSATRPLGFYFDAGSGSADPFAGLGLLPNGQYWGYDDETVPPPAALGPAVDNHTDFHVFRVAQAPGAATFSVWRDGMLLSDTLTDAFPAVNVDKIQFGDDGEDWGGGVLEVDYLRFTGGAYAPIPEPGTLVLLVGALLSLLVWRRR